jgi:uncharacterized protein with HEPN domain
MSRDYRLYLNDILQAIAKINGYVQGQTLDQFKANNLTIDAVALNLMIIGEAARNIPDEIQKRHPAVDWRNIVGLRNIITHEYFRLNLDRIWNLIEVELPLLHEQINKILEENEGDEEG